MNNEIPRLIIQILIGVNKSLSILNQAAVHSIRSLNPGFEYKFFDDKDIEDFIVTNYPDFLSLYRSYNYNIQKVDFFRYLAIYHFGGFYFDLDVILARSLEALLGCQCVFSFEELTEFQFLRDEYNMDWEVGNYAFGAIPKHPVLGAIIENCIRAQTDPIWLNLMLKPFPPPFRKDYFVLCSTGPGLVSRTIAERPDLVDKVTILFPEDVCDRRNWGHFGDFGIHLAKGTWRQESGFFGHGLGRFLANRWFEWMRRGQLKASKERGPKRNIGSFVSEGA
jgi:hypothetical protein